MRVVVESQIIRSVGYERSSQQLEVEFRNGWIYEYEGVPPEVHRELMEAKSHGGYLHRRIVDRFETRRTR